MKVCTACGCPKPFSEYTKHKLGRDGLRPRCKTCTAVDSAAYRTRSVERRKAYNDRYRIEHREQQSAKNRAWNRANRDRVNASIRAYRVRHRERIAMAKALRRKLGASRQSAAAALQRVALYGGRCYYCGAPADTIDHRIPICRGGTNLPANLVPACRSCNSRKRHRTEREWKEVRLNHG